MDLKKYMDTIPSGQFMDKLLVKVNIYIQTFLSFNFMAICVQIKVVSTKTLLVRVRNLIETLPCPKAEFQNSSRSVH